MPAGAQVSPDGHYWWDETSQDWQLIEGGPVAAAAPAGSAASAAPADGSAPAAGAPDAAAAPAGPPARTGSISIEIGTITDEAYSHEQVVAMVQQGGGELPTLPEGEAYA